ncbi:GspE/PulE family protein [Cyanobium sp. Morenito 9A2]|uniref:GspE/PulE family protein n=1 Tax=Cyanobium sp. Morenito 9A2 TaxID=2823718 RepID=UPI0020CEAE54|nr:GspE/PulE family protein [Cyanobium sp. Morenito 9A2]MCP9850298.1 type II/IV secretion system protein [Cyanobium sp. Morenito 9A2]
MTLTPARPVPAAKTTAQQRLEVELLMGEQVLRPEVLGQGSGDVSSNSSVLSPERCRELGCLVVGREGNRVTIAIPTFWGLEQRLALGEELSEKGLQTELRMALQEEIETALTGRGSLTSASDSGAPMDELDDGDEEEEEDLPPPRLSLLDDLNIPGRLEESKEEDTNNMDLESSINASNASPIISLVDKILIQALSTGTSDIHVEPQEDGLVIRFRQDGVLQQLEKLPKNIIPAVTSRLKIMSDLDIAERRLPQDGRIRRVFRGRTFDLRVSTLPTKYGEKVVMRLLDSGATQLGLDKLITDPLALETLRDLGSKPFGMILVTGPTGSGKSTTLYSLLAERNSPDINISTVEDPIEYTLKGITQSQVNRDKGFDFSIALRAFMRQDPDVLLVGETRDLETAKTAIEAALTGHLVLTTLHCNDAPSAIARLSEMGVEPFMVSASLLGIVSQRLVRRVCPSCRIEYHPTSLELGRFGLLSSSEENVTFFKAKKTHHAGSGICPTCQGSGYKGRIGVYEVLRINENLTTAIAQQSTTDQIRKIAIESGMKTLLSYGLDLVRQGYTTLEEIERIILTDSGLESERRARAITTSTCRGCGAGMRDEWLECPYCLTARM